MFGWLTEDVIRSLPDPVEASLLALDLQLRHYLAAVRSGQTSRAIDEALKVQCEAARLADWAQLAGYHHQVSPEVGGHNAGRRDRARPTGACGEAAFPREVPHG